MDIKKTCLNCKWYNSGREWILPMNGEVTFKCHSNGCACYHWEEIPNPDAIKMYSKSIIGENGIPCMKYYFIKDGKEILI